MLDRHGLSFQHMISFASETCNVMKGSLNGVIAKLRAKQPQVVDIHCNCHVLHLSMKSKMLPFKIDELMVDIFYHFYYSDKHVTQSMRRSVTLS